jgi:hypothetical protein
VTTPFQQLIWDLEESLESEGYLPLYSFSWWVRGQKRGLTEQDIAALCGEAYEEITQLHRLHLEWFDWPALDLSSGRPAAPDTPLDFDINTTGEVSTPFLALVPD